MNNLAIKYLILYVIVLLSAAYAKADGEKRWVSEINSYVMLYEKCDGKFTLDPSSKSAYFGVKISLGLVRSDHPNFNGGNNEKTKRTNMGWQKTPREFQ